MNKKNITDYFNLYEKEKNKIDIHLQKIFTNKRPKSLYSPASYIIKNGGKRIRPMLLLFSAKAVGSKFSQVRQAALAVELLHSFSLVHDDIMDNADKRRNHLTLHKKYDLSTAILSGDSILSIAYAQLLKNPTIYTKEVLNIFTKALVDICEGQSLDKEYETKKNVTILDYKKMINKKTAALTEMSCELGAVIGGADNNKIKILKTFGRNIGMAFQIRDDLLDITGNEDKFGKPVGGDLVEGKRTFLLIKSLELAKGKDKKILNQLLKNKGIKKSEINIIKSIYERLGILEKTELEIKNYTKKALKQLNGLNKNESQLLFWLADYLLKRNI